MEVKMENYTTNSLIAKLTGESKLNEQKKILLSEENFLFANLLFDLKNSINKLRMNK